MEAISELKNRSTKANLNNIKYVFIEVVKCMSELHAENAMLKGQLSVLCSASVVPSPAPYVSPVHNKVQENGPPRSHADV